ncbi:MAG: PIG-L deacetylase family protein [Cellulomonas sp.]
MVWRQVTRLARLRTMRATAVIVVALAVCVGEIVHEPRLDHNPVFAGDVVVFYPEHPDDEVLWGGSAIRAAIDTKGADNVYVVLVSRGLGATPFLAPARFGELTGAQRGQLREDEFRAAMAALGVAPPNVVVLADPGRRSEDGFAQMRQAALGFERRAAAAGRTVTHVAHSYVLDNNRLHRSNGRVIKDLLDQGLIANALFWIKPEFKYNVPVGDLVRFQALAPADSTAVHAAIDAYTRTVSAAGLEAIGFRSTPWYFYMLEWDAHLTSLLHTAAVPG